MKMDSLIYELLKTEPFYAHFILESHISYEHRPCVEDVPYVTTAAAGVKNGVPHLIFNTQFMDRYGLKTQTAILKHEVLHLLFKHTYQIHGALNKQVWNIAMDCAINQHISDLPVPHVTVEQLEGLVNKPLQRKQTATYYFNQLLDKAEQLAAEGKLPDSLDDHSFLESNSDADEANATAATAQAASKALKRAAGSISDALQQAIGHLNKPAQVNWKAQLRNLIASAAAHSFTNTRKKAHRRFDLEQPGKKKKKELKLAVCADSSGSVSNEQFAALINEVATMVKMAAEVNLIYADTEVQKVVNLKNGKRPPAERFGNGGTAYQPAITKALQLGANCIIYLGDMDCADKPTDPAVPFIWVTVGSEQRPGEFGRMLKIEG